MMVPPPNPYKRRPISPVRYPTLPWAPNKKQRQNAHRRNEHEKKNSNEACLGNEDDDEESESDKDADEARKCKGSQPSVGAMAIFLITLSKQEVVSNNAASPTLPWSPNKEQGKSANRPNEDEKNKSNEACLGDEDDDNDESNKDADEARKCKGSQPSAEAMAKILISLSKHKVVSNKSARLGHNNDNINERQRSGLFSVDVADKERKGIDEGNGACCSITFFRVFSTGFHCSDCQTPVGSGYDAVCRHLKKFHRNTVIGNVSKLHAEMVATKERLSRLNHNEPETTVFSMPEIQP